MAFAIETDSVCKKLEKVLLHQHPGRLLYLWINNIRKGFVNTVLRVNTVLNWAALGLWIGYIALLAAGILRACGRHPLTAPGETGGPDQGRQIPLLAGLVLWGTLVNSMVVGAIIFPQTRYMIYNMGLFYVCLMLLAEARRSYRSCAADPFVHS